MDFKKTLLVAGLLATSAAANATTILPGSEQSLQSILDDITIGGDSSVNVNTDQASPDEIWTNSDSGISPALFAIEVAGNSGSNTFGIYDENDTTNYYQLFSGSDSSGDDSTFSVLDDGSVLVDYATASANGASDADILASILAGDTQFDTGIDFSTGNFGFYLGNSNPVFFSQESDNSENDDQMVAFQGKGDSVSIAGETKSWTSGGWILAFEDVDISTGGSDQDFNDLVVMIESSRPVSEPGSLALFGLGLAGLAAARRKQAKA